MHRAARCCNGTISSVSSAPDVNARRRSESFRCGSQMGADLGARDRCTHRLRERPFSGRPLLSLLPRERLAGVDLDASSWAIGAARDSAVGAVRRHLGTSIDAPRGLLLRSGR